MLLDQLRQSCVPLDDKKIALLIDAAWKELVPMGTELIQASSKLTSPSEKQT